jgi:hypothetical protein
MKLLIPAALAAVLLCMTLHPAPAQAQAPGADSPRWQLGASIPVAHIASPFAWRCDAEVVERATVSGVEAHASLVTGRLDLTMRLTAAAETTSIVCPAIARVRDDGVHRVDHHFGEVEGDWLVAGEASAGFSPAVVPFLRAGIGAGWMWGADAPFATAVLGVRLGRRVRLLGDAGVHLSSTPYVRVDEEWRNHEIVARHEVGQGRSWAAGPIVRVGVETTLR